MLGQRAAAGLMLGGVLAALLAVLAGPAQATPPRGADDPVFAAALSAWLDDDEEAALTALAALARQDNRAAQVLLGLIDKSPTLQGPWLSRLPRARRLELLRDTGGMSGQSWLAVAADEPLARAWLALMRVEADLDLGAVFAALGEARAAREAVVVLAAREHDDLAQDWRDWMDPETAYLVWPRAPAPLRDRIRALVPEGHAQWALMGGETGPDALARWLDTSPAAAALRRLCAEECPASATTCQPAGYAALGSHNAAITLGSPVESLVPNSDFLASRRGRSAILRRMLLSADLRGRRGLIARVREVDTCLADRLEVEDARYRYIRDGAPPSGG